MFVWAARIGVHLTRIAHVRRKMLGSSVCLKGCVRTVEQSEVKEHWVDACATRDKEYSRNVFLYWLQHWLYMYQDIHLIQIFVWYLNYVCIRWKIKFAAICAWHKTTLLADQPLECMINTLRSTETVALFDVLWGGRFAWC